MSDDSAIQTEDQTRYKPRKKTILGMGLLFFVIVGLVAFALCNFRIQYATQTVLNHQRDVQQAWLDKSLDAIRVWRNELVEQARFISSAEMFRLFVVDTMDFSPKEVESLSLPDTLHSPDDSLRSMAEQLNYIQDLLKDFTARRAWTDVRILLPGGTVLAAPEFSNPVSNEQKELVRQAADKGRAIFGPVRRNESGLVMDMADPMHEVLGSEDPKTIAVLLLTVPMDQPLTTFLARNGEQAETLLPRIIDQNSDTLEMILSQAGKLRVDPAQDIKKLENLPFGRRPGLDGKSEVYSIGGMPTSLEWLYVLETPASEIDAHIQSQKMQIYGLGVLASIGMALLAAWIWAGHTSRRYEAEAIKFEKLYRTIHNQKMILDSINASFQAGMVLVDPWGRVQMFNPAFAEICGDKKEIERGSPLVQILPDKVALHLLEDINQVSDAGQSASDEVEMQIKMKDGNMETRLYRVTFYPYSDVSEKTKKAGGCVAIFQDITDFRRKALAEKQKAENERKRQIALISAFVRAIESVDENLVGHSDKMAGISALLAKQLQFDDKETETLELAAKLSQVGKIYVPRQLLTKKGKLTPEELQELRKAPEYADKILHDLHFDLPVQETVRMIGEKVDGSGKPAGLVGDQISLCGRALGVVNAFIAMTSPRAWRGDEGLSIDEALRLLHADPGFDSKIVDALAQMPRDQIGKIIGKTK